MIAPEQIVREARRWLGTPFQHQARVRGVGVDCVGLPLAVCRDLGAPVEGLDVAGYSRTPGRVNLGGAPLRQLIEKRLGDVCGEAAGTLALLRLGRCECHVGIVTDCGTMIHACGSIGRVVEHTLDAKWRKRITGFFKLPGVMYG